LQCNAILASQIAPEDGASAAADSPAAGIITITQGKSTHDQVTSKLQTNSTPRTNAITSLTITVNNIQVR
jgi:hypothetical protein